MKENSWDIQRTLLSRLVTKINYQYYDESTETWVDDDSPPPKTMAKGTVKSVYFHFNLNGAERVHKIYLRNKPSSPPLIY